MMFKTVKTAPEGNAGWSSWTACLLAYLLLAACIFAFPRFPESGLDASWRMVLGRLIADGAQFGHDTIFTYGPLGFIMGKTYSGLQFWSLIAGQLLIALTYPAVIMLSGRGLTGLSRFFYYLYFVVLGVTYEDALHMTVIAMIGFELLRLASDDRSHYVRRLGVLLAFIAAIKFTHILLTTFIVLVAAGYAWKRGRELLSRRILIWYFGALLAIWILCRQNPVWIPSYLLQSLQISKGYENSMGLPPQPGLLGLGLAVLGLVGAYTVIHFVLAKDRLRAAANALILWALLYLNWKHGFIRADGHVIGFFLCALGPILGFPWILADANRLRWLLRLILLPAALCSVMAVRAMFPPVIDSAFYLTQEKVKLLIGQIQDWTNFRASYDKKLDAAAAEADMLHTRDVVGKATVDVLGHDQSIALFNNLNYHPRPVFQSYTVYTPALDRLNRDFFVSDKAPDYILAKLEPIDERLLSMDDASIITLLPHHYNYVLSERGIPLWHRKPKDQRAPLADLLPKHLQDYTIKFGETIDLSALSDRDLWMSVDIKETLIGRLRSFFYKPARVNLIVEDTEGKVSVYRMPTLIGKTGFMLNPIIENMTDHTTYAIGRGGRKIKKVSFGVSPQEHNYLKKKFAVTISGLPPIPPLSMTALQVNQDRFWMFKTPPDETSTPAATPTVVGIDKQPAIIMHAPSVMTYNLPRGVKQASGYFGYLPSAYMDGGQTDGAVFNVVWTDGTKREILFSRSLTPRERPDDRGLKEFNVDLTPYNGGRLLFEITDGAHGSNAWDWTAWSRIQIK